MTTAHHTSGRLRTILAAIALSTCALLPAAALDVRLSDIAKARELPPGAPKASDVVMRNLMPHPRNSADPYDSIAAIKGFHITRLEWTYTENKSFIDKVHALGVWFGGAASAGNYKGSVPSEQWNVVDINGKPVYATWMRAWKKPNPWGCPNNPEFRAGHLRFVIATVDAGADGLQRDEPAQSKHALRWGGCFCEHCMNGFRTYLQTHADAAKLRELGVIDLTSFDYRAYLKSKNAPEGDDFMKGPADYLRSQFEAFQIASTIAFNRWWRTELNRHAGRSVSVSCNNGVRDWGDIELSFDFCIGELNASDATPEYLYAAMKRASDFNRSQTVTMPLRSDTNETADYIALIRRTIALVYAVGGHIEAPWDTYLPTPKGDRFFGAPASYADQFAFIRGMSGYLDGYEDAFVTGGNLDDRRWKNAPALVISGNTKGIAAFIRAIPGKQTAPAVIHLIDTKKEPAPFSLSLNPQSFFGERPFRVRMCTPLPYEKQAHDRAFTVKDYGTLVRSVTVCEPYRTDIAVPALSPNVILVVEPAADAAGGVWQPNFIGDDMRFYDAMTLTIGCATAGAAVRYTLDGTEPTERSALYQKPMVLTDTATVRARAFTRNASSAIASAHFIRRSRPLNLIQNGEFDDGMNGWKKVIWPGKGSDKALLADIDAAAKISGKNSMKLTVNEKTGAVYHLRLTQQFTAEAQKEYVLTFRAAASSPVKCRVGLQGAEPPHKVVGMREMAIGEQPSLYRLTGENSGDTFEALVQFDLGGVDPATDIWIDDVRLERVAD
ncbi:MAG: chitobiase/beta-hexosaminidase C-terminal domain-containing protein [Spirochaetes bacterium]|nr:chitobiase/beta-hexosaminidase C-terminal domain-containing protein [Spirochaetota bacterium]